MHPRRLSFIKRSGFLHEDICSKSFKPQFVFVITQIEGSLLDPSLRKEPLFLFAPQVVQLSWLFSFLSMIVILMLIIKIQRVLLMHRVMFFRLSRKKKDNSQCVHRATFIIVDVQQKWHPLSLLQDERCCLRLL